MTKSPKYQAVALDKPRLYTKHPLDTVNIFSRLFYTWATPLLMLGNKRQLQSSDLWPLQDVNKCDNISRIFEPKYRETKSIFRASLSVFGRRAIFIGCLQLFAMLANLYGPIVLQQVVSVVESSNNDFRMLLVPIVTLFAVKLAQAVIQTQSTFQNELIAVQFCSVLQNLLYKKAIALNAKSRKIKSTGEISNLFATDIDQVLAALYTANDIWITPLQVIALLYMLWQILGYAMFSGTVVILTAFVVNRFLATASRNNRKKLMKKKDTRMKTINEVFGSMQIIKLNAWEERYGDKIRGLRDDELKSLWTGSCISAGTIAMNYIAPVALTTVSFASYVLILKQPLTASKVFTALYLFNMVKGPMMQLPQIIATWMQSLVSYRRFVEFLSLEERDPAAVTTTVSSNDLAIEIVDGSFGWDAEKPFFQHLNLAIKRGELVVIHGSVGEGKSSLANVLLGELDKYAGSVGVRGRVSYFAQQPWIQNMSIRENILFGLPYDRVKYNRVLEACALQKDLELFAAGDRTEIGSKGVNVSGGQKARISLARACYSDADIFILDSPLSAVDAIVQNEIFTKCLLGLLRHKTILLVTHSPEIIGSQFVDRVIEIKEGQIVETLHESKKEDHDVLVPPLKARSFHEVDNEDDLPIEGDIPSATLHYEDSLVSPSIKSPFGAHLEEHLFTPIGESLQKTYSEEDTSGKLVVVEEREAGRVSSEVFMAYFNAVGGWPVVLTLLVVQCTWQGLQVASDLWLSAWTSTGSKLTPEEFHANAQYNISIYAILAVGSSVMVVFRSLTSLAPDSALLRAPMRFFDANPLGRILNRFSGDINQVDGRIPGYISYFMATLFMLLFSLGTTIFVIKSMGLILLPLMWIYYKVGSMFVQPARELERLSKTTRSPMITHISESIDGAVLVRAFGAKQVRRFERTHQAKVDRNNETNFCFELAGQWFTLRIQMISATMLFITTVSLVWMRNYLTAGLIGLVFNYSLQITAQLEGIVWVWSGLETAMIAPERVAEYTNVDQEAPRLQERQLPVQTKDPLVLKDISFDVKSGEKIGIVGRTGAGKSSLTMALFRINEIASGTVEIAGVNTATVGVKTLRESMAIIPQNPILFKGTLRSYLDPFDQYSDAQLWDVLKKVRLTDRIASETDKLASIVEENGENYSVGERQMLCMARALLRQAKIVIMDEATAAMDHETDQNLQRVIREEFAISTVLTIAHRLDTVLDADRILVFDQGKVVQCDAPAALVNAGSGIFFDLCQEGGYLDKVKISE
ncbi:Aste57867_20972 [Aphanomyces stellatus]|uniref:Aste57867_20972 protein n=1 Tax=Aphanomyces stellatus TaxID=120398 RepID=A0A485LGG4_9STRA|nr:hypothetical protein As57867_020904 [Aphanomyces stellatus]VFT97648.1 Aste57867_20972 [Aphanomyces stellatus]